MECLNGRSSPVIDPAVLLEDVKSEMRALEARFQEEREEEKRNFLKRIEDLKQRQLEQVVKMLQIQVEAAKPAHNEAAGCEKMAIATFDDPEDDELWSSEDETSFKARQIKMNKLKMIGK
jgi:hypothetical protein